MAGATGFVIVDGGVGGGGIDAVDFAVGGGVLFCQRRGL